jgi:hypothetical protein
LELFEEKNLQLIDEDKIGLQFHDERVQFSVIEGRFTTFDKKSFHLYWVFYVMDFHEINNESQR